MTTPETEPTFEPEPPTQIRHPWRATLRTAFAVLVALATLVPLVLNDTGMPASALGAQVVVVAGLITRVLAMPAVNAFLTSFAPWLAASPHRT